MQFQSSHSCSVSCLVILGMVVLCWRSVFGCWEAIQPRRSFQIFTRSGICYSWWECALSMLGGFTMNSLPCLLMSLEVVMKVQRLRSMLLRNMDVYIHSGLILNGSGHLTSSTISTLLRWNSQSSSVSSKWLSVLFYHYQSYHVKNGQQSSLQKLHRLLLRMASPTNIFLLNLRIHVYFDYLQMDYRMGIWKRYFISTINYWADDRLAIGHGINRRKAFMGYVVTVSIAIQLTYDRIDMCTLDAYSQTTNLVYPVAVSTSTQTSWESSRG